MKTRQQKIKLLFDIMTGLESNQKTLTEYRKKLNKMTDLELDSELSNMGY